MNLNLDKKSILKKTVQFGGLTFISKILGITRDLLLGRYLGVGIISDAFIMAFKIPNFLRRIFAEGALSAAFVPIFVKKIKNEELDNPNGLMTISFLFFEGIVFLLCVLVFLFPDLVLKIIAPGFSQEQINYAIPCLKLLFPLIFFISSSALFAGALNSINHFFVPAFGPILLNITYIITLLLGLKYKFSVNYLCIGVLLGGFFNFIAHLIVYLHYNFGFAKIDLQAKQAFRLILKKFGPSFLGVSVIEINLFVDMVIASYLPAGSVSILNYSSLFVNMPVGILAVGFATILLPHFSRYALYAPKRLNFYVLEVTKFLTFIALPIMLFMIFVSKNIFSILMLGKKASIDIVFNASWVLTILSFGLLFFFLNKVLVNIFYSLHDTKYPSIALIISTLTNFIGNIISLKYFGVFGIAASTAISAFLLTFMFLILLHKKHNFRFYYLNYFRFLYRYLLQLIIITPIFLILYFLLKINLITNMLFWPIIFIMAGFWGLALYFTRKIFKIKLYFLTK